MNIRMLRQFVLPAMLCGQLAVVPLPAVGQSGAGADDPQNVADRLADELVSGMRDHPELHRQRVALQPLDPKDFVALDKRERRRLHDLLVGSLRSEIRANYDLADPSNFAAIARILEGRGDPRWFDEYMELFRTAKAQINISCTASPSSPGYFEVSCKAFTMEPSENRGTGKGEFSKDWLAAPMDPDWALASIAQEIVAYMQGVGGLDPITSVDSKEKSQTVLSGEVAKMLRDKFSAKRRSWPGWRPVDAAKGEAGHRAVVEVQRYEDKLNLRVELYSWPEDIFQTSFRESMNWTPELRKHAGVAGKRSVPGGKCEAGADPGERWLEDEGMTLADWVLFEGDRLEEAARLETADYEFYRDVMIDAKRHLADHCEWTDVSTIMDVAIAGLAKELGAEIERGARSGLERLRRVEASAGKHLKLLELRARAHELLGERREQDRAYSEWLEVAPRTEEYRDRRLDILKAKRRIRAEIRAEDDEISLELDGPQRSLVRRGVLSFGHDGGEGSAEFDTRFRVALQRWQASNGRVKTGYLTADQAKALMDAGRAAEERKQDDEAFALAKAANTAAAYDAYLAEFPNGLHAAEAKRLLDAARAREDEARARKAAEAAEQALALEAGDRVLIERGLAAWKAGGGSVDGRFDGSFRALLRSWQASKGHLDTGYLTGEQARALIAEGQRAEEWENDDRTFARAKVADTAAAYEAYLSEYPDGRHAAEARRLLKAIHVREDDAAFARAKRADTAAAYAAYLSQYPDGRHAAQARRLREAARVREAAAEEEEALRLTLAERERAERGLASWRTGGGSVDGRFDAAFRKALRSWQASRGDAATGYLTRGQADALMGLGLEVEERKRDDAAFARAKAANTVASYTAYLAEYPNGRHVAEAKRRREAAREEEEWRKAAAPAEVEKALRLTQGQKALVQHGLVSKGYEIGAVDGVLGRRTRSAIRSHQGREGLARTGHLTAELSRALQVLGKRQVKKVREALKPGRRFRDCEGRWCPQMVVVPAGSYMMGSPGSEEGRYDDEGPRHRVRIGKPFAVGVTEVTRGEFGRFVRETGHSTGNACRTYEGGKWKERSGRSWRNPGYNQTDAHPVVCVSWADAQAYVKWLSRETGESYRLLSESEWEYMARAGTTGPFHFGATLSTAQANYDGRFTYGSGREGRYRERTEPVGSFPVNAFGVHDVHGNVSEWVEDCWHRSYAGAPADGRAWTVGGDCGRRVLRGGSWLNGPQFLRSANRFWNTAGFRDDFAGFRVARTLD